MIRIPLRARDGSVRAYALVDDCDAELASLRWCLHGEGYAHRRDGRRYVLLHRAVMGLVAGDGREVDHRNRDRLDCRRENLRVVAKGANQQNVAANRGGRSPFRGVAWHKHRGRWMARLTVSGRHVHVGYFDCDRAAALAVEARRRELMPLAEPDPELAKALALA